MMHECARTRTIVHVHALSLVFTPVNFVFTSVNFVFARRLASKISASALFNSENEYAASREQGQSQRNEFAAVRDRAQSHANVHDRARTDTIVRTSTSSRAIVHNRVCLRIAVNSFSLTCVLVFAVTRALTDIE